MIRSSGFRRLLASSHDPNACPLLSMVPCANACLPAHTTPDGSPSLANGSPCNANTVDPCSAWPACGGDSRDHAFRRSKWSWRHTLRRGSNQQDEARYSKPPDHMHLPLYTVPQIDCSDKCSLSALFHVCDLGTDGAATTDNTVSELFACAA
jgi:hypothetical protein